MIANDLTHGIAFENLAHEDADEDRPRSNSLPPVVQFADDSDHSDKEVCCIEGLGGKKGTGVCVPPFSSPELRSFGQRRGSRALAGCEAGSL